MHPGFFRWWKHMMHDVEGARARSRCGPGPWSGFDASSGHGGFGFGGAPFGVRRPLRFLIHKLELDERQAAELAAIIDALKTERAQAAVDNRRSVSAIADLLAGAAFDQAAAEAAASERTRSAERLGQAVARALGQLHELLNDDQRRKLAYLIRSGALSI